MAKLGVSFCVASWLMFDCCNQQYTYWTTLMMTVEVIFLSSCWFWECFECSKQQFTQMNNMDYWSVVFDSWGYFAIVLVLLMYWLYSIIMAGQGWHHQDSSIRMAASRWTEVEVFLLCHYVGFVGTLRLCFSYCWWLCNCGSIVVVVVLPCHMVYSLFVKLAWLRQSHSCCGFVMVDYWWLCPHLFGTLVALYW